MEGWIKLHRKFLKWEWYGKSEMVHLFLHLLLNANHEDKKWRGVMVKRGQLITGIKSLSNETHLSFKKIRTCLSLLQKTGEIGRQSGNQYSIITICNYDDYQVINEQEGKQPGNQRASKGQARGKQGATNKNVKNYKNVKNSISVADDFDKIFEEWYQYKDERKEHLTEIGIKKQIKEMLNKYPNALQFRKDVDHSMANNWQGIHPKDKAYGEKPQKETEIVHIND